MKNISILSTILILLVSLNSGTLKAQNEFAPIGAEWFHNMSEYNDLEYFYQGNKVYYSKVLGDTIIDGITARHIAVRPYFDNDFITDRYRSQIMEVVRYDYYVYNTTDTVFYYNELFQKFTPLYIFNVQLGDTLKMYPASGVSECFGQMDSGYFSIVIDSVKMVDWGGVMLKTVYNHPLFDTVGGWALYHYRYANSYNAEGVYVEKLGSPNTGFQPFLFGIDSVGGGAADDPMIKCQMPIALRCYSEPATVLGAISVNMVDSSCDFGLLAKTGINNSAKPFSNVAIYPNPVNNTLHLSNLPIGAAVAVYDVLGRKVYAASVQQSSLKINTESWS